MTHLPDLSLATFTQRLRRALPEELVPRAVLAVPALYAHYQELRRWASKVSLVGPGTAREVVERHYAESIAALPLLGPEAQTLLDIGSGAGFPGFVLAAAVPALAVTLIEPRERRWAFLCQATRRAALNCRCVNVRVASPLPAGLPERVDVLTFRALRPEPAILAPLAERFSPHAQVLVWAGEDDPDVPPGFARGRTVRLPGAAVRRVFEMVRVV